VIYSYLLPFSTESLFKLLMSGGDWNRRYKGWNVPETEQKDAEKQLITTTIVLHEIHYVTQLLQ